MIAYGAGNDYDDLFDGYERYYPSKTKDEDDREALTQGYAADVEEL